MEINNFAIPRFLSKRGRLGCFSEQTTKEKFFIWIWLPCRTSTNSSERAKWMKIFRLDHFADHLKVHMQCYREVKETRIFRTSIKVDHKKAIIYFFLVTRLRLIFISFSILNVRDTKFNRLVFKGSSQNINMHRHCCMLHVYFNTCGIDSKIKTLMAACLCMTISLGTLYNSSFYAIFIMNSNKA